MIAKCLLCRQRYGPVSFHNEGRHISIARPNGTVRLLLCIGSPIGLSPELPSLPIWREISRFLIKYRKSPDLGRRNDTTSVVCRSRKTPYSSVLRGPPCCIEPRKPIFRAVRDRHQSVHWLPKPGRKSAFPRCAVVIYLIVFRTMSDKPPK